MSGNLIRLLSLAPNHDESRDTAAALGACDMTYVDRRVTKVSAFSGTTIDDARSTVKVVDTDN